MRAVPFEQTAISAYASREAWDARATELLAIMLGRWALTAGAAFVGGEAASVIHVTDEHGRAAVLKIGYPHFEAVWEAVGLESLGTGCAPAVLRQDPWTWALLLEEIAPGDTLLTSALPAEEALDVGLELYGRALRAPVPRHMLRLEDALENYRSAAEATLRGQEPLLRAERVLEPMLASFADSETLLATTPRMALLHGDLNPGNIIRGRRIPEPSRDARPGRADSPRQPEAARWFLIDPKPMIGDPAFDLAPLLNQIGTASRKAHSPERLWKFTRLASARLGIDAERVARWARFRSALDVTWYLQDAAHREVERSIAAVLSWGRVIDYAEGTRSA